ncbi:MAG: TIM-barrel domain-containing protein, partial [Candidatus Heimdallarchaeaceae archaeon]
MSNKTREHYFGFGEATGELDKVNNTVAFWNTDSLPYDNKRKNLYQSQPIQVTIQENGLIYAIIYDNPYKSTISVEKNEAGYITEYSVAGGGIIYYLIVSSSISGLFSELTYILGKVPLPPLNSLGHHQSLWSYKNEEEVRKVAETFRNKQIPCDFIHLDIDYMDGYRIFTWNKERFPNIKELSSELLEKHNIKLLAITDPGVKVDPEYFMYKEGIKDNHFVKNEDGKTLFEGEVWPGQCHFPDF